MTFIPNCNKPEGHDSNSNFIIFILCIILILMALSWYLKAFETIVVDKPFHCPEYILKSVQEGLDK